MSRSSRSSSHAAPSSSSSSSSSAPHDSENKEQQIQHDIHHLEGMSAEDQEKIFFTGFHLRDLSTTVIKSHREQHESALTSLESDLRGHVLLGVELGAALIGPAHQAQKSDVKASTIETIKQEMQRKAHLQAMIAFCVHVRHLLTIGELTYNTDIENLFKAFYKQKLQEKTEEVASETQQIIQDFLKSFDGSAPVGADVDEADAEVQRVDQPQTLQNFLCPLSQALVVDPVRAPRCKHLFSRAAIIHHFQLSDKYKQLVKAKKKDEAMHIKLTCPMIGCKESFSLQQLYSDLTTEVDVRNLQASAARSRASQSQSAADELEQEHDSGQEEVVIERVRMERGKGRKKDVVKKEKMRAEREEEDLDEE